MENLLLVAVVDHHVKAATQGHQELLLTLEGMTVTPHSARHIVDPVVTLHLERHMNAALDEREVAPRVLYLGQLDDTNYFINA